MKPILENNEPSPALPSIADASDARRGRGSALLRTPSAALFALTALLSSALLFLLEPMFAKLVLPRLGGTAAVWNTCLVFFQACLLCGYAYAHWVSQRLRVRQQVILHACVLALPLIFLPVALPRNWNPPAGANPIPWLLLLLTVSVGLPFFVVSTTAPLIQRWFSSTSHQDAADPYFLYVASNVGSMFALLAYPTVVEPLLRLGDQSRLWTFGYAAFAALMLVCGITAALRDRPPASAEPARSEDATDVDPTEPIGWARRLRWIALAAVPSSYLLGVTTYLTTDVAAVPLLWVLPLAIYLLTFILVFARRPIVSHRLMVYALPTAVLAPLFFLVPRAALPVWAGVGLHSWAFFVCAMVCHGELARLRPAARSLTDFYLMMSLGGVLGGAFNALAAPILFTRALEYPLAMALACLLCPPRSMFVAAGDVAPRPTSRRSAVLGVIVALGAGALAWAVLAVVSARELGMPAKLLGLALPILLCTGLAGRRFAFAVGIAGLLFVATFFPNERAHLLQMRRSFFGVHRLTRSADGSFNSLSHGTTLHGRQRVDAQGHPAGADEALTYYHATGPLGDVMAARAAQGRQDVGVIGLGVGSIAAYARPGDRYTFYEIDSVVRWAADESGHFSYLRSARQRGAQLNVIMGDGRLTIAAAKPHSIDLLVLDAFSGDAIPVHLLTREALAIYLAKLKDEGILAIHISNKYLDLEPVVANLAAAAGCSAVGKNDLNISEREQLAGKTPSKWMLIARDRPTLHGALTAAGWSDVSPPVSRVWTDDYSNIIAILH